MLYYIHFLDTSSIACRFEPWWIARRADIIPYDVRYRGYGKNKLQHLHELVNDLGFR